MKFSKGEIFFLFALFLFGLAIMLIIMQYLSVPNNPVKPQQKQWQIESIDTMKYSRDMARADLTNPKYATEAEKQVSDIAATGANYVAIDTPYDDEFLPVLQVWVRAARTHRLHVWFRGNFSGWEGWFGYDKIDSQTHLAKTKQFILENATLFQNGDIFTSCPECENGANLQTGDISAVITHRKFLIDEYDITKSAFAQIGKNVKSNYYSMNADVARAVMDKPTTQALDGIVVIDHYVLTPEQMADDVSSIAAQSGGQIVLGEFGAPIPDIHGAMTEDQQAAWLSKSLQMLSGVNALLGVNYWVDKGGSTALWRTNGTPKPAVKILKEYYQ
jgi:hypothetical protein